MITHEANFTQGFGAEIAAFVQVHLKLIFLFKDAKIIKVNL